MLQIASGKLFSHGPVQRNELRGIVHTNLQLYGRAPIETAAGRLLPTSFLRDTGTAVYELTELIEGEPGPGAVVSHGIDPYVSDFTAIVSFALNVTCTPDHELTRRLTRSQPGPLVGVAPSSLVSRTFDSQVWCHDDDATTLAGFVSDLIGLERKTYLASIRAIRNYIIGLHRLVDDPELTYTLLVASIESLTQGFDGNVPNWEDYPEDKRCKIDKALEETDDQTRERVKSALLEIEHVAASRRFCEFTLDHLQPSYFREEASGSENPIGRADLPRALNRAYGLRSKHIHELGELPTLLTAVPHHGDSLSMGGVTILTFQGMARLARHVINDFIRSQPKVTTEIYDYSRERAGIVHVPLAPKYWIGRVETLTASSGRKRLEGFLGQLVGFVRGGQAVTDLRDILVKAEQLLPNIGKSRRRPYLALYILFNRLAMAETPMQNYDAVITRYREEVEHPSVEAMVVHLLLGTVPEWPLEEHHSVHDAYLRSHGKRNCLRIPRELRAGLSLDLATRYQAVGKAEHAHYLISTAVENHPGNDFLHQLETSFDPEKPINWRLKDLSSKPDPNPNAEHQSAIEP